MKKITLSLTPDQLAYLATYTSDIHHWLNRKYQDDKIVGIQQMARPLPGALYSTKQVLVLRAFLICTASYIQKLAIALAIKLTKPVPKSGSYEITLADGKAEALHVFMRLQPHVFPERLYNEIFLQIDPKFH